MKRTFKYECPICGHLKILQYNAYGLILSCDCGHHYDATDNEIGGGFSDPIEELLSTYGMSYRD